MFMVHLPANGYARLCEHAKATLLTQTKTVFRFTPSTPPRLRPQELVHRADGNATVP